MRKHTLALIVLLPTLVHAQDLNVRRGAVMAGKNEISTQLGFQASLGGTTPSGAKLMIDYSRHVKGIVWFNAKLAPTFSAVGRGVCVDRFGVAYDCGVAVLGGGGHALDALVGVKLKWPLRRVPIVPYLGLNAGVVGIFDRPDPGVAGVFRPSGGFRYFVTPHVGLGGEMAFTFGGAYYQESCPGCRNAHTQFYRALDMVFGAEFVL